MPGYFVSKMVDTAIEWKFESLDYASVIVRLNLNEEIKKGPGITKVNADVLDDHY